MKVVNSINQIYTKQKEINEVLKKHVDEIFFTKKESGWHYVSRIKSEESFALKLETGRFDDVSQLEDFFACTIVVENISAIKRAKKLVREFFKVAIQRPDKESYTTKDSSSFVFDDLRMYVTLKPTNARSKGPVNKILFEIQIKTFLQHAWVIATHDLIYKSDEINWAKQRVAYQVKAILENAEVSIEKASSTKKLNGLPSNNPKVERQNEVKSFIRRNFEEEILPNDLVRLVDNIDYLLSSLNIDVEILEESLLKETSLGKGSKTVNLSPYLIIVQTVINQHADVLRKMLGRKNKRKRNKILMPSELDMTLLGVDIENNGWVIIP
jgi:ppGpp synthetase/RelA/SpoT-type nucleotidyltranferase